MDYTPAFLLSLLAVGLVSTVSVMDTSPQERPNIVVVSMESVPTDRLPCYGYERDTAPELCGFAEENATIYQRAYTPGTFTVLSLSSVATGFYPYELGIYRVYGFIPRKFQTTAQVLSVAGYSTFESGLSGVTAKGLERGYSSNFSLHNISEIIQDSENPVFLRAHVWSTHSPYTGALDQNSSYRYLDDFESGKTEKFLERLESGETAGNTSHLQDIYDQNLRETDREIYSPIIKDLKDSGEYSNTLIVFFGDHGEMLGENGQWGHGLEGHREEMLKVPLIVKYPGQKEGRISERLTTTLDIRSTVLAAAGIEKNTRSVELGENREEPVYAFSHGFYSMINSTHRLTLCPPRLEMCEQERELFRYRNGTAVKVEGKTYAGQEMEQRLREHLNRSKRDPGPEKRSRFRERLEELGYVS